MKRCPDCGFRANDNVCPLCGVRMRPEVTAAKEIKTHVHREGGEPCFLPENQQKQQKRRERERQVRQTRSGSSFQWPSGRQSQKNGKNPLAGVVIVILFLLLRACAG